MDVLLAQFPTASQLRKKGKISNSNNYFPNKISDDQNSKKLIRSISPQLRKEVQKGNPK